MGDFYAIKTRSHDVEMHINRRVDVGDGASSLGGDGEAIAVDVLTLAYHDAVERQEATPPE